MFNKLGIQNIEVRVSGSRIWTRSLRSGPSETGRTAPPLSRADPTALPDPPWPRPKEAGHLDELAGDLWALVVVLKEDEGLVSNSHATRVLH